VAPRALRERTLRPQRLLHLVLLESDGAAAEVFWIALAKREPGEPGSALPPTFLGTSGLAWRQDFRIRRLQSACLAARTDVEEHENTLAVESLR
jgi:hypothetical protein